LSSSDLRILHTGARRSPFARSRIT